MPGMNSGVNPADPTVVAAFRSALLHQGLIALGILVALLLIWGAAQAWAPALGRGGAPAGGQVAGDAAAGPARPAAGAARGARRGAGGAPEPSWRRVLRVGFGVLWILDGILQAQAKMAAGMPSQVIQPTAASSPPWVQHLVNWGGTAWSYHPIQAGAAAVWIQAGIGIWLIVAARGPWSRLAGLASVGWGLVVWVFGESFGGIFAPGLTWLFGAPGAVLIYCVAGALIALPERAWGSPRLGRLLLGGTGLFFIGMAVLQAWPGRGFWQGMSHGQPGTLTGMVQNMAQTSQPHFLSALVADFGGFSAAHGFAVNLVAVIALAVIGAGFVTGRPRLARAAVIAGIVLCLADWVLIEDLGFLGGLGTDPNSMIPMILVFTAGYLALVRVPAPAAAGQPATEGQREPEAGPAGPTGPGSPGWRGRLRLAALGEAAALASGRSVAAVGAVALIVLGAGPMALASASRNADPILAQAIDGASAPVDYPAPAFSLTDQRGAPVSLASLRGKAVLLTFLDPVCVSDCPLIAQEFRQAGLQLGAAASHVELVAIVINPLFYTVAFTRAFDRQENLADVSDWLYLTSSPARLASIWRAYGVTGEISPAGAMIAHNDIVFAIDRAGHVRNILDFDPGPGTAPTKASFATQLSDAAQQMLRSS